MKTDDWIVGCGMPCSDEGGEETPWGLIVALSLVVIVAFLFAFLSGLWGVQRYPIGQPVSPSVYTEPFDPCDPAYKFIMPAPKDWTDQFGSNERTMLLHAVSELRVVAAVQGRRIMVLEALHKNELTPKDPNEAKR